MKINGAIFDLDGTILDSSWVWEQIDKDFLGKRNIPIPEDYMEIIVAMSFEDTATYTIERFGLNETKESVLAEWNNMAYEAYKSKVKLKPGAKYLLEFLKDKKIPIGVATSNISYLYEPCLKNNGIFEYFDVFVEVDKVGVSKDFPDVYLQCANKLGVKARECMVFEDIVSALTSAKKAGFLTTCVWESVWQYDKEMLNKCADYVVYDLSEAISNFK